MEDFDRLLWELDNRIASSVEMRGLAAKQRDEAWKAVWDSVEPDWPLRCRTRAGLNFEFYSVTAFQSWLKGLTEVRNGFGELVARYPPDGMTYGELEKLIGLAVSRGANVESVVSGSDSIAEKANAVPDLAQQVLDTVYAARLNTVRKPGGIVTPYKPITTNEQGVTFHAPDFFRDWSWTTSPAFATTYAALLSIMISLGAPAWSLVTTVLTFAAYWSLGARDRDKDDG